MIKQPILAELQYFVKSVSLLYKGVPLKDTGALVKSALHLLEDLPSTRDAVFDYFTLVFNNAVKVYMLSAEKNLPDPSVDDEAVQEIHEALERLVTVGPTAWCPVISSWCLKLLGEVCKKHCRRRPPDIRGACNLWLGCSAIRYLLSLSALCFEKLDQREMDECINEMLVIYGTHTPFFDWVVARLGGCFPLRVMSSMLSMGVARFTGDFDQPSESEVEVLSYLGLAHENDLRKALKSTLEHVASYKQPIPYLLMLAKASETISQALVAVFLELHDENRLSTLTVLPKNWPANIGLPYVLHTVAGLLLKMKKHAIRVTLILAKMSTQHSWCQELLEMMFIELETLVLDKHTAALLEDIIRDGMREMLWSSCTSDVPYLQQVAVRLILLASFKSNSVFHQTIVYLLSVSEPALAASTKPHLNALVRVLGGPHGTVDVPKVKPAFETAFEKILISPCKRGECWNILHNLVELLKLERTAILGSTLRKVNCTGMMHELLDRVLKIWENFMSRERQDDTQGGGYGTVRATLEVQENANEPGKRVKNERPEPMETDEQHRLGTGSRTVTYKDLIHETVRLIECMDLGKSVTIGTAQTLKLSQLLVKYFFYCLKLSTAGTSVPSGTVPESLDESLNRVYGLLSKHCGHRKAARTAALRELLEGALFMYGDLFGSQAESQAYSFDKPDDLLIRLNQKQGIALNASRATVLHAGIIGQGPKIPSKKAVGPASEMQNHLLNAIVACCQDVNDHQATIDGFSYVSLLLVEMISPDVMYNGLPWPEEDFIRVTMERDLQIQRTFRHSPILWSILGLVACYRPSLCYCSVLLRALCASALHQWRSKTAETLNGQKTDLLYMTTKLLELMALAQLLPPPLSYLHIVLEYFDGPEIAYVLKECVWNYMKDHVPSPVLFVCDPTGFHWRDPLTSRPPLQYTNPLRNTMQKKLTKVGHLYHQMFVGPELRNPSASNSGQPTQQSLVQGYIVGGSGAGDQGSKAGPSGGFAGHALGPGQEPL
ncbi:integrator complex subunit 5 [Anopheles merus]|uniref:Integrator complex subunit 5 C-terminal domain-containing protein n=1 Tax=Anopheles merus TaxID=30066 RepID=A0A182UMI5_ANOME|nr:integrator complex subunit 5 [Anopheles merus]XP_041787995.1 integrator complex subunit 5 [Anopheles merus]